MNSRTRTYFISFGIITLLAVFMVIGLTIYVEAQAPTPSIITFFGLLVTLAGSLVGVLVVGGAIYYRNALMKQKHQEQLAESYEQDQKEEFIRLSQQGLELEKQRTGLEKQTKIMVWIFAAIEKAEDDPRLAFIIVYQGLETEIHSLISRQFSDDTPNYGDKQTFNLSYDFDFLAKYVTPDQTRTILQMRDLRNRIVHGEVGPEEITPEKVKEYLQEALHLAQVISRIKQDDEI